MQCYIARGIGNATSSRTDRATRKFLFAKATFSSKEAKEIGNPLAGPALLDALKRELPDKRKWETQYQMIMALGFCGCKEAIPLLEILAHERFEYTMVLVAVGDAYVRLCRSTDDDPKPVFDIFQINNNHLLLDGALRAVAMLQMKFPPDTVARIIEHVTGRNEESLWFWVAAASPGWSGSAVDAFLERCTGNINWVPGSDKHHGAEPCNPLPTSYFKTGYVVTIPVRDSYPQSLFGFGMQ